MLRRDYEGQVCSVARALEIVGERWSLLIVRDVLNGIRRFDDLRESLGITRSVLTARLEWLVAEGVLARRPYQQRPERFEYVPTGKALALAPVITHLAAWGERFYPDPLGPRRLITHRGCGGAPDRHLHCARCGEALGPRDLDSRPGPAVTARA